MVNVCAGLDLSGSERRCSGVSIVRVREDYGIDLVFVGEACTDDEITRILMKHNVRVVAIDAPLNMPMAGKHFREVDLKLIKMGYKVLPPSWASMRKLAERAIRLMEELKNQGVLVIETHPASSLKSSGCGSFDVLAQRLGLNVPRGLSRDEIDAVISAIVCAFHMLGADVVVKSRDGEISILPGICID